MRFRRIIPTLLALLAVVAGIGVPAALVVCRGVDHVAVESVLAALHCGDEAAVSLPAVTASDDAVVAEADCTDLPVAVDAPVRSAGSDNVVPAPLPPVLIAVLPAEVERPVLCGHTTEVDAVPPPHLLPLRSFVLLT